MRAFGFWVLFLVAIFTFSCCSCREIDSDSALTSYQDMTTLNQDGDTSAITNRRLKVSLLLERSYSISTPKNKRDLDGVSIEDYPLFDPTPSSKAAVKAGPIQHGTPLLPYIPRPTPPGHPRHGSP